jgi:hypothetical protein
MVRELLLAASSSIQMWMLYLDAVRNYNHASSQWQHRSIGRRISSFAQTRTSPQRLRPSGARPGCTMVGTDNPTTRNCHKCQLGPASRIGGNASSPKDCGRPADPSEPCTYLLPSGPHL